MLVKLRPMSFKQNGDHGSFSSPTTRKYEAKEQLITIDVKKIMDWTILSLVTT